MVHNYYMTGEQSPQPGNVNLGWSIVEGSFDSTNTSLSPALMDGLDESWVNSLGDLPRARMLAAQAVLDAMRECDPKLFADEQMANQVEMSVGGASAMCEAFSYSERAGALRDESLGLDLKATPVMQAVDFLLEQSTIEQPRVRYDPRSKSDVLKYKPISKADVRRMSEAIIRYLFVQQHPAELADGV